MLEYAFACQWFGVLMLPQKWSDLWLVVGLAKYATAQAMRILFGHNEYAVRLKKDIKRICEMDIDRIGIGDEKAYPIPPQAETLDFIALKAPVVLHMLDCQLRKAGPTFDLKFVLCMLFDATEGESHFNTYAIGTNDLFDVCEKSSGFDLQQFKTQWIFQSGCPVFEFTYAFNRKKMAVEIKMKQDTTHAAWSVGHPSKAEYKPFKARIISTVDRM
jgi:transcription initiation factor TFIID subunit 2